MMAMPDAESIAFAHWLDDIFHPLQPAIVLATLLSLLLFACGIYGTRVARQSGQLILPFYLASALGLMSFFGITIASLVTSHFIVRASVEKLDAIFSGRLKKITVDGHAVADDRGLFQALRNYQSHLPPADHGQPLPHDYLLHVETSEGRLSLILRRNAKHAHEYWLSDPTFKMTDDGPVGHIETAALDDLI